MNFTEEQNKAVFARDEQILVAAAAGSGKTFVLVHRILGLIDGLQQTVDIDRLLVVTFTNLAAAEMKERIEREIDARLEENPLNENLLRQSSRLVVASISTLHAFCRKLIKDNFHILDLDPAFRVADNTELNLLQSQIMESLFEESYSSNEKFSALVDIFGGGKTKDVSLDKLIRRLFKFIESRPFPEQSVEQYIKMANADLSIWLDIVKSEISETLDTALSYAQKAREICYLPQGPEKYLLALVNDETLIKSLKKQVDNGTLENMFSAFEEIDYLRLFSYKGKAKEEIDEDLADQVKEIRKTEIKKRITAAKEKFFFAEPAKMAADMQNIAPIITELFNIVLQYRKLYIAEKKARNLVDVNDLEHYAIQLLWQGDFSEPEKLVPSAVAQALSAKFSEILIDEYQDINEVQDKILSAIKSRHFMVGDVKQSIYGFRHAKPQLFIDKYNNIDINTILLSKNFRSRQEVLKAVNFLFFRLMEFDEIEYNEDTALNFGADFPQVDFDFTAELHLSELQKPEQSEETKETAKQTEESKANLALRQEAQIIANRIKKIKQESQYNYSDIVILLRSIKSTSAIFVEELKTQGIPAVAETAGSFFETQEIMVALSLLRVVDNPRQDIDLITTLRLYGFSSDEMLAIRLCTDKRDYFDCILDYIQIGNDKNLVDRLQNLLNSIDYWRSQARVLPISRLIGILYEETGLPYRFNTMDDGELRRANLQLLLEKAIQYETTSFTGLFEFVRYVEWLQVNSDDSAESMILPKDNNIVRVMSVHKSKGLEFPIVFLSQLGRQFNEMDERSGVILHPHFGLGAMYTDLTARTRSNTLARVALSVLRQRETTAEELRILYVATTRAKEKLILTGVSSDFAKDMSKWQNLAQPKMPKHAIKDAKNFLDWIVPAVLHSDEHIKLEIHEDITVETLETVNLNLKRKKADKSDKKNAFPAINWKLPSGMVKADKFRSRVTLPSKLSISEIKRIFELDPMSTSFFEKFEENDEIFAPPTFYTAEKITPLRLGTVLHTIIEHLDLQKEESIPQLIENLVAKGLISQEESAAVNISKIQKFVNSNLATQMRTAKYIQKETPFVMGISPNEVYGTGSTQKSILVHGIIDCYFETQDGKIILVDFKSTSNQELLQKRYTTQMQIYKKALEQSTGKPVTEAIFYSF
ncbi:MAG: helicase-exonuclease AddAB subunit AddA [Firmicutes bacterium]|nr:helicase-exonuclease AddAB subunit AddA [Bacillota bacterium]